MKEGGQALLGGLDVVVDRNHFGTQLNSFETEVRLNIDGEESSANGIFIRAPAVLEVGDGVEVLCKLPPPEFNDEIVAVRQDHLVATAFHVRGQCNAWCAHQLIRM